MIDKIKSIKQKSQNEIEVTNRIEKIIQIQAFLKDEIAQRHYCN